MAKEKLSKSASKSAQKNHVQKNHAQKNHAQKRINPVNPKKVLDSKWTAVHPENREKHFVVIKCSYSSPGVLDQVELEAIYTGKTYQFHWRELKDRNRWRIGWA